MSILLVGLNHRTAPLNVRESLALSGDSLRSALNDLRGLASVQEAVILSTCNRLEIYVEATREAADSIEQLMTQWGGLKLDELRLHLFCYEGEATIRHLLRVAAGLESLILGETQVLGQVADALDIAQNSHSSGAILSHLFAEAVHTGRRARNETEISRHSTSVSHIAARLAHEQAGDAARVLIVGAGEMAVLAAQAVKETRHEITVINRTYSKALALAHEVNGRALDWLQLGSALAWADVVISATSAALPIIHANEVAERGRALMLIDLALPRDIDAAVSTLPYIKLWTLDDLQARVEANLAQRSAAIAPVEAIVEQETALFLDWLRSREVAPVITDLQRWARGVAESEITQALNRLDTPDAHTEQVIARMAHRLVGKLLHEPTVRLKLHAAEGEGQDYAETLRDLFGLDAETLDVLESETHVG
ncbi:MAG: glutamyl-tRNA reductase [Chloroflexi bacterium]|nr:glutamyl-tRNA reductase [Chloroflexota bacterium]